MTLDIDRSASQWGSAPAYLGDEAIENVTSHVLTFY